MLSKSREWITHYRQDWSVSRSDRKNVTISSNPESNLPKFKLKILNKNCNKEENAHAQFTDTSQIITDYHRMKQHGINYSYLVYLEGSRGGEGGSYGNMDAVQMQGTNSFNSLLVDAVSKRRWDRRDSLRMSMLMGRSSKGTPPPMPTPAPQRPQDWRITPAMPSRAMVAGEYSDSSTPLSWVGNWLLSGGDLGIGFFPGKRV